jgi:hypothetical protein
MAANNTPTVYIAKGTRADAKAICDSLAGTWIIIGDKAPYTLIEQNDLEKVFPLDDLSPDEIRERAQIIKDNVDTELNYIERRKSE